MSAEFDSFTRAAMREWPGWTRVHAFRSDGRLFITLSVSEVAIDAEMGPAGPSAVLEKLMKGASVQQLVKRVLMLEGNQGLKRYGRKRRAR